MHRMYKTYFYCLGNWVEMPFDINILKAKIEAIKQAYENGRFADALVGALNTGNGLMQQRIFVGTKDIEGNDFGPYVGKKSSLSARNKAKLLGSASATDKKRIKAAAGLELTPYQRKRANKGRQILRKDLEFTGGLRRAIETAVENEKSAVIQFNNREAAIVASGQEAQITNIRSGKKGTTKGTGIKIFTLDQKERQQVDEQGLELINEILIPKQ